MSNKAMADAFIHYEIAKLARSATPGPDQTFVNGMIEMATALSFLTFDEAEAYRQAAELKAGARRAQLRIAA